MTDTDGFYERFDGDIDSLFDKYEDGTEEKEIDDTCILCGRPLKKEEAEMCKHCQNEDGIE